MTLIGPILDDRTWQQLRDELVQRIPTYTPEWTNHNASDPGIVLLDLFAYLGESLLFRFNQIPDATRVAFLRLLGIEPMPAQAATVVAVVRTERPDGAQLLAHSELPAGAVTFETDVEVFAWPLDVVGAGRFLVPELQQGDLTDAQFRRERSRRLDALGRIGIADPAKAQFFETRLLPADPAAADAAALDVSDTLDRSLWIALLATDTTDLAQLGGHTVFLGVAMDETVEQPFTLDALDDMEADRFRAGRLDEDPPATRWHIWTGPPAAGVLAATALRQLEVARDSTRGMTTTGVVALTLPNDLAGIAEAVRSTPPAGRRTPLGDSTQEPPPLEDPDQAARLITWLQVRRSADAADVIGRVRWVGVNVVTASQLRTAQPELLGTGTGQPDQAFQLANRDVVHGSVRLEVEEPGAWREWTEAEDFLTTETADRHYLLDRAAGVVRFPQGGARGGRVPQIGERVRVRTYRYGGGAAGNVPAGTVTGPGGLTVTNPLPAVGGKDAESLGDALARIPAEVHRRDRAVTPDDFRALAMRVSGVARAEALELFHPDTPTVPAAGVVSVMVIPNEDSAHPGAPTPDQGLLRRVAGYLNVRRLVTTELYVIPPEYVSIAVSAGVAVRDGYQVDAVRRWVELILRQFLAPVPPYGPDGEGWPHGRLVRRAELEAVAVQVDGVEFVEGLRLAVGAGTTPRTWSERDLIQMQRWQLPELVAITVVQGTPLPPGEGHPAPPSTVPAGTVLVPLPREVC
jgi:predicted phage baseplate assembly protein